MEIPDWNPGSKILNNDPRRGFWIGILNREPGKIDGDPRLESRAKNPEKSSHVRILDRDPELGILESAPGLRILKNNPRQGS